MARKYDETPSYEVLRNVVLANGGTMTIVPDVMRSPSFQGWRAYQIRRLVYRIRLKHTDGEIWALYHGCIYAREEDLPPEIWKKLCDKRTSKISGVADQNRIYEEKYKKIRREKEAKKVLDSNIKVLGQTMNSSLEVRQTLNDLEGE